MASRVEIPSLMVAPCFSQNSSEVVGYNFNYGSIIFILSSNWTQPTFAFATSTPAASFLIFDYGYASLRICSLGIVLHVSMTRNSGQELYACSVSFSFKAFIFLVNIYSFFTLSWLMRLSALLPSFQFLCHSCIHHVENLVGECFYVHPNYLECA